MDTNPPRNYNTAVKTGRQSRGLLEQAERTQEKSRQSTGLLGSLIRLIRLKNRKTWN
jgi:hypothetical protein